MSLDSHFDKTVASVRPLCGGHMPPAPERPMLYALTTISGSIGDRTPAICRSFERAEAIVLRNEGDIWETCYSLCVIESLIPDALYGSLRGEQYWYAWDLEGGQYVPIHKPEAYEGIVGFCE